MGEVGIVYKLMPDDIDTDLEEIIENLKKNITDKANINHTKIVPIAFGLKSIELGLILDDKVGGGEEVDAFLGSLPGISSVDVISQTLIS